MSALLKLKPGKGRLSGFSILKINESHMPGILIRSSGKYFDDGLLGRVCAVHSICVDCTFIPPHCGKMLHYFALIENDADQRAGKPLKPCSHFVFGSESG